MLSRSAISRLTTAIAALALAGSVLAGSAFASSAATFGDLVRLGFPNGDDWEPSIAADRLGHVYTFSTHYVG